MPEGAAPSLDRAGLIVFVLLVLAFFAAQSWLLFIKRSGEVAYLPPASATVPSLEIAGDAMLVQSFVPRTDGLVAVVLYPRRTTRDPVGPLEAELYGAGLDSPLATFSGPASDVARLPEWHWEIPRIQSAAGRVFTIKVRLPAAQPGEGLSFETGPPWYPFGDLSIGGRPQWADLKFQTQSGRTRTIDTLRLLRRQASWPLRLEIVPVAWLILVDSALVTLAWFLLSGDRRQS